VTGFQSASEEQTRLLIFRLLRRSWLELAAPAVVVFISVGYVSIAMSAAACEQETSQWLAQQMAANPGNAPERHAIAEPANFRGPWIVTVDYEWAISNTGGEWGTRFYVSLFGRQVLLRSVVRMQS
jgi:hypothetical protein